MRFIWLAVLAFLLPIDAATHSDAWNQNTGGDQSIEDYGSYTLLEGTMVIPNGNVGRFSQSSGAYCTARRDDASPTANQYSQIVITAAQIANSVYCGPMVRGQTGANSSYHAETDGNGTVYLSKCLAGTQSTLTSFSQSWAAGDVLRIEVTGAGSPVTLKIYHAAAASPTVFSQVGTDYDDSSSPITTAGQYGVFGYGAAAGNGGGPWEAGGLAGGGGATAPPSGLLLRGGGK